MYSPVTTSPRRQTRRYVESAGVNAIEAQVGTRTLSIAAPFGESRDA